MAISHLYITLCVVIDTEGSRNSSGTDYGRKYLDVEAVVFERSSQSRGQFIGKVAHRH